MLTVIVIAQQFYFEIRITLRKVGYFAHDWRIIKAKLYFLFGLNYLYFSLGCTHLRMKVMLNKLVITLEFAFVNSFEKFLNDFPLLLIGTIFYLLF
jgi:hypothetical protein